jgi:hypothetical protein
VKAHCYVLWRIIFIWCWKAWEYRRWVEEGLIGEIEDPLEAVKWQRVLGGEGFLRKLKDQWNQRVDRPKNYGQKKKLVSCRSRADP